MLNLSLFKIKQMLGEIFIYNLFSAAPLLDPIISLLLDTFDDGTVITVNYNQSSANLTSLLNNLTFNPYINTSMYDYLGSSSTLTKDLEWAITQGKGKSVRLQPYEVFEIFKRLSF